MISPEPEEDSFFGAEDKHTRVIIHFDIDCFYAQVEMVKNPSLRDKPMGVQQQTLVVTANYPARKKGVGKCISVAEAKKLCPELILINGEDVSPYREYAVKITNLLREYSETVEKLGFDENFLDATDVVNGRSTRSAPDSIPGCIFQDADYKDIEPCECGCHELLIKGAVLAQNIRERIFTEIGLTTCAGISWNKLVSKLIGPLHKPNNQTVIFPDQVQTLMASLNSVRQIPGIGRATVDKLSSVGVTSVAELQVCSLNELEKVFDKPYTNRLMKLSFGVDDSQVKTYERNKSIGVEDSCEPVKAFSGCSPKLDKVLQRVSKLLVEDGRIPSSLKVSVRIREESSGRTLRESRQGGVNASIFRGKAANIMLPEVKSVLLKKCVELVSKMVDKEAKLYITLFGISFSKLGEPVLSSCGPSSLVSFFRQTSKTSSIPRSEVTAQPMVQALAARCSNNQIIEPLTPSCAFRQTSNASCSEQGKDSQREVAKQLMSREFPCKKDKLNEPVVPSSSVDFCQQSSETSCLEQGGDSLVAQPIEVPRRDPSQKELRLNSVSVASSSGGSRSTACTDLMQEKLILNSSSGLGGSEGASGECTLYLDEKILSELPLEIKNEVLASYKSPSPSLKRVPTLKRVSDCPPDCDPDVYASLPQEIKDELAFKWTRSVSSSPPAPKRQRSLLDFISKAK